MLLLPMLVLFLASSAYGEVNEFLIRYSKEIYILGDELRYDLQAKCYFKPEGLKCLGNTLPYTSSSMKLIENYFEDARLAEDRLKELENAAKLYPKCWKVIQPMLCLVFKPPCSPVNPIIDSIERIRRPCRSLCQNIQENCEDLMSLKIWPKFLNCDNNDIFTDKHCLKHLGSFKWHKETKCPKYLVPTNNPAAALKEFPGCVMGCLDPFYTDKEHQEMSSIIFWSATTCAIINFLAILTYVINWNSGTYPDRALMYLNCSFLIFCIGWIIQFAVFSVEEITCNTDGTLRTSQSFSSENNLSGLPCLLTFILVHFSTMAIAMWFLILCFMWCMKFEAIETRKFDKKNAWFHVIGWLLPLINTLLMIYFQAVDGYNVTGVCFVSTKKVLFGMSILFWTVLLPIMIIIVVSAIFISSRIMSMIRFLKKCRKLSLPVRTKEMIKTIIDMAVFWSVPLIAIVFSVYVHVIDSSRAEPLLKLFKSHYLSCVQYSENIHINIDCSAKIPNVGFHNISKLVCLIFIVGGWMSCFLWNWLSLTSWVTFFRRVFGKKKNIPFRKLPPIPIITLKRF